MDKSMSVAAAKQELHATLERKDEELMKTNDRIKELDAEHETLQNNISQGWHQICTVVICLLSLLLFLISDCILFICVGSVVQCDLIQCVLKVAFDVNEICQ